jgi:hypothetical protein
VTTIVLLISMFPAWALFFLVAYLLDDQAHGGRRRIGGAR